MIKFFRHIRKTLINQNQMGNPSSAKATAGKYLKYAAHELDKMFGLIGFPNIFHSNNGNMFTASKIVDSNPSILTKMDLPSKPNNL